jgi:hypothetical protein
MAAGCRGAGENECNAIALIAAANNLQGIFYGMGNSGLT